MNSFRILAASLCLMLFGAPPVAAATLLNTDHPLAGRIIDGRQNTAMSEAALRERLLGAELVLLGETHDNPEHHRLQKRLLDLRLAAGGKPALAMEQFDIGTQAALDEAQQGGGDADVLAAAGKLGKAWDWPDYRPLVTAALAQKLPVVAINLPRERLRPVIRSGFSAALGAADLARLQVESVWSPAREAYLVRLIEDSHCGRIDAALRDGLVRAQRLRDASMADAMLARIEHGVVAILGRGHARRDVGVPRYIEARRPETRILSIGFVEVSADKQRVEDYDAEHIDGIAAYDIVWFTPRADRPDPCASFGKP